jgi:hypothetical protein
VNGGANCIEPLRVFCDLLYASLGDFDVWVMRAEPESAANVPINLTLAPHTRIRS